MKTEFLFSEDDFVEYYKERERKRVKKSGFFVALFGVPFFIASLVWALSTNFSGESVVVLMISAFIAGFGLYMAFVGTTVIKRTAGRWQPVIVPYFERHYIDVRNENRPWSFGIKTEARDNGISIRYFTKKKNGRISQYPEEVIPYSEFERIVETDSMIIVLRKYDYGSILKTFWAFNYADSLAQRDYIDDAFFSKQKLSTHDQEQLKAFISKQIEQSSSNN